MFLDYSAARGFQSEVGRAMGAQHSMYSRHTREASDDQPERKGKPFGHFSVSGIEERHTSHFTSNGSLNEQKNLTTKVCPNCVFSNVNNYPISWIQVNYIFS